MTRGAHRLSVVVRSATRDADKYADLCTQFTQEHNAKQPANGSYSLEILQELSHLNSKAEQCLNAVGYCVARLQRAQNKIYQHGQLVQVLNRTTHAKTLTGVRETLAQVAAHYTPKEKLFPDKSPLLARTLSPIATCIASNAPNTDRHKTALGELATT